MKKKLLIGIIVGCMLNGGMAAYADNTVQNGIVYEKNSPSAYMGELLKHEALDESNCRFYYSEYENFVEVDSIGGNPTPETGLQGVDVIIPNEINGKPVKEVDISGLNLIRKITIPANVEKIYYDHNENSKSTFIEVIEVDTNNKYFSSVNGVLCNKDKDLLILCPKFKNVTNSIFDNMAETLRIGDYAFYGCENIYDLVLPDKVVSIGKEAFSCSSIQSLVLSKYVKSCGLAAFQGISNLKYLEYYDGLDVSECIGYDWEAKRDNGKVILTKEGYSIPEKPIESNPVNGDQTSGDPVKNNDPVNGDQTSGDPVKNNDPVEGNQTSGDPVKNDSGEDTKQATQTVVTGIGTKTYDGKSLLGIGIVSITSLISLIKIKKHN